MFTLPDLPYAYDALEPFIDAQTMQIHHGKHHAAYVKNLNDLLPDKTESDLEEILKTTTDPKVRNNGGGHYNHSLFWKLMGAKGTPNSKIMELKEQFNKAALSQFGSGWAWITVDSGQLTVESTANQDIPKNKIVFGLDVWEHAYYLKYQNRRAEYIDAWWNVINWEYVGQIVA